MAADGELPWTTSRCHRLLRPLSSKLAKLRTELERSRSASNETRGASIAFATNGSPHKTTNFTRPAHKPRGFDKASDPDWSPSAKPGSSKRTYGRRGARNLVKVQSNTSGSSHVERPGEIALTPLIVRLGGQLHSSPHAQNSPLKKYGSNRGPLQVAIDWTQMPGDLRKLIQGVSEAYANVLQATTGGGEKSWRGTRSLMSACLRKVPAYIELEEHFAKLDREEEDLGEERDVTAEIYEHLESQFEQRPGQGWRSLKRVVRAHATSLLCDAVSDEVLELDSLTMLVTHCINVSAWDEAERLLTAYIPLLEPLSIPNSIKADIFNVQRSPYLSALKKFVDRTGRLGLLFDLFEHMIAHELLPLEWLATECMRPVWNKLVQSIADNVHRTIAHALRLLETITIAGMGLPDERLPEDEATGHRRFNPSSRGDLRLALSTTFSSSLTVFCSIALVHRGRDDDIGKSIVQRVTWMLDALVITIMKQQNIQTELDLLEPDVEDEQTFAQRAVWTIFASFVVRLGKCPADESRILLDIPDLIHGLNWLAGQYASTNIASILGSLPPLVSSITRGCGRIWQDDGFAQLQRLVQGLMSLSGYRLPHKLWTLKRLALESAIEFAQDTRKPEYLNYARDVERSMKTQGRLVIMPSPQKNDSPAAGGSFRWEDGIGEWVACTPFVKQAVKRLPRKPLPVLNLLPTPMPSDEEFLPADHTESGSVCDTTAFDQEGDDEGPPLSPHKKVQRNSCSSLGKRYRASSPRVLIAAKRTRSSSPDTSVEFYPQLPEEQAADGGPGRSYSSRNELNTLISRPQTQRSRSSLESGLRHQQRKSYTEYVTIETQRSNDTNAESESERSSGSRAMSSDIESQSRTRGRPREGRKSHKLHQYDDFCDDSDERDDLSITPARPPIKRRTSSKNAPQGRRAWWKIGGGFVSDGDDDEDELSFQ